MELCCMSRLVAVLTTAIVLVASVGSRAGAQLAGHRSGGADFTPVDAAALGDMRLGSVGLSLGEGVIAGGGGWGLAGGALRGAGGANAYRWSLGAGYARTLGTHALTHSLEATLGGELFGGFGHEDRQPQSDLGTVRLTIPLGVSIGDPSGTSLGLFAAPYAESGIARRWRAVGCDPYCRYERTGASADYALGTGAGVRASLGRFGLELMFPDIAVARRAPHLSEPALGLSYRMGSSGR